MENLPVYRSAWISSVARAAFSSLFRQVIQQIRQLRDKRSIGVKLCCWGWIRICRSPPNPPSSSSGFLLHRHERKIREKLEKHSSLKRKKGAHFPYSPLPEGGWRVYCWLSALVIAHARSSLWDWGENRLPLTRQRIFHYSECPWLVIHVFLPQTVWQCLNTSLIIAILTVKHTQECVCVGAARVCRWAEGSLCISLAVN